MTLLAAYNFDEASGAIVDVTGNGHGFTLDASVTRQTGHTNTGLRHETTAANGAGPTIFGQTAQRTSMCWVKRTSNAVDGWIVEMKDGVGSTGLWGFLFTGANMQARCKNPGSTIFFVQIAQPTVNVWYHAAMTFDGAKVHLFINGVEQLTGTTVTGGSLHTGATIFPFHDTVSSETIIDDVRIYDAALDAATITTLMNTPVSGVIDLVVAGASQAQTAENVAVNERVRYYTFEEGTDGGTPSVAGDYLALSGTVVYDDAAAAHGGMGLLSTNNSFLTVATGTPDTGGFAVHFTPVAVTSGVPRVISLTDSANSFMGCFRVHTDGKFDITDGASTRQAASTASWVAGTRYWVAGTLSGTGTARTIAVKVYSDDGTDTLLWDSGGVAVTAANANTWVRARVGNQGGTTGSIEIDDVRFYDTVAFAEPIPFNVALVVANAAQAQAAGAPAPTQVHNLTVDAASQTQVTGSPVLVQAHQLVVGDALQAQTSGTSSLTQAHTLAVDGATQTQVSGTGSLTQAHVLVVDAATHVQVADGVTLTQTHVLTVSGATQTQTAEQVTINSGSALSPGDALQGQTADGVTLTQAHLLAVDAAAQAQVAGAVSLSSEIMLVLADAPQAQSADGVVLTQNHVLVAQSAIHDQVSDVAGVTAEDTLVVGSVQQAQVVENPTLTLVGDGSTLLVANANHTIYSTRIPLNGVGEVHVFLWNGTSKVPVIIHGM